VTVLFLPHERVVDRLPVRDGGLQGIIAPAGPGSIAIVGVPGEALDDIERRVRLAVRFAAREGPDDRVGRRERNA
jgi:hypothetical protein